MRYDDYTRDDPDAADPLAELRYIARDRGLGGAPESRWLLKALREAAGEIEGQVFGLSGEQLCRRPADEDRSLRETVDHLRHAEEAYLRWLQLMVARHEPDLPGIDPEGEAAEEDGPPEDVYDALMSFAHLRTQTAHLLWSLSPAEWESGGIHPYRGRLTIAQLAREMNEHDLEHLWQMRRLRRLVEEDETADGEG